MELWKCLVNHNIFRTAINGNLKSIFLDYINQKLLGASHQKSMSAAAMENQDHLFNILDKETYNILQIYTINIFPFFSSKEHITSAVLGPGCNTIKSKLYTFLPNSVFSDIM